MTSAGHARGEERIGALTLRHAPPPEGDAPYRRRPEGPLEIERTRADVPRTTPGVVTLLIAVLGLLLLVFATIVRSGPAIGAVSFALVALAWLILRSRDTVDRVERLRVDEDRLRLEGVEEPLSVPVADVERVDLGLDAGSLRTVFASVAKRGRVMLFDGLTAQEAEAVADALRAALGHVPAERPSTARVELDRDVPVDPVPEPAPRRDLDEDDRARLAAFARDHRPR